MSNGRRYIGRNDGAVHMFILLHRVPRFGLNFVSNRRGNLGTAWVHPHAAAGLPAPENDQHVQFPRFRADVIDTVNWTFAFTIETAAPIFTM